jgi:hypothetical protein
MLDAPRERVGDPIVEPGEAVVRRHDPQHPEGEVDVAEVGMAAIGGEIVERRHVPGLGAEGHRLGRDQALQAGLDRGHELRLLLGVCEGDLGEAEGGHLVRGQRPLPVEARAPGVERRDGDPGLEVLDHAAREGGLDLLIAFKKSLGVAAGAAAREGRGEGDHQRDAHHRPHEGSIEGARHPATMPRPAPAANSPRCPASPKCGSLGA